MKFSVKLPVAAVVVLLTGVPIAFAQSGSTPQRPADIAGRWALELSGKYGKCAGPITIDPSRHSSGDDWTAIYAITCDGDAGPKREPFVITYDAVRGYHFDSSGIYPDVFDLRWTADGKALVGSGAFGNQPLSASMHR